jgi:hypothetical protein
MIPAGTPVAIRPIFPPYSVRSGVVVRLSEDGFHMVRTESGRTYGYDLSELDDRAARLDGHRTRRCLLACGLSPEAFASRELGRRIEHLRTLSEREHTILRRLARRQVAHLYIAA